MLRESSFFDFIGWYGFLVNLRFLLFNVILTWLSFECNNDRWRMIIKCIFRTGNFTYIGICIILQRLIMLGDDEIGFAFLFFKCWLLNNWVFLLIKCFSGGFFSEIGSRRLTVDLWFHYCTQWQYFSLNEF